MELVEGETLEQRVNRMGRCRLISRWNRRAGGARFDGCGTARSRAPRSQAEQHHDRRRRLKLFVKVVDFGLAKAKVESAGINSHPGFSGTPRFASPEQLAGDGSTLDVRSDIYSLGMTLWWSLDSPGCDPTKGNEQQLQPVPFDPLAHLPGRLSHCFDSCSHTTQPIDHNLRASFWQRSQAKDALRSNRAGAKRFLLPD